MKTAREMADSHDWRAAEQNRYFVERNEGYTLWWRCARCGFLQLWYAKPPGKKPEQSVVSCERKLMEEAIK